MVKVVLSAILMLFASPVFAQPQCISTSLYLHAYTSPADQHERLLRSALEQGAATAQTHVVPSSTPFRYLVLTTICDAFVRDAGNRDERPVRTAAVTIPDDHPYDWLQVPTLADAAAALAMHADSAASGHASLGDGSIAVFWTKAKR